ncbi:MAG: chemoreceptor glutamine deamidase CheD [Proteobacteria bacterium]|nr:chemoreceptor glutamine deamidase CheD [Pseudomonadota bacterium]
MNQLLRFPEAPARPETLPGFKHIHRTWDRHNERWSARILPGEYFVTRNDEIIQTVLGSCISACVRDPALRIGGMNHFMLPEDITNGSSSWHDPTIGLSTRYGSFAMESLINDLLKLGAKRERLEIKLTGGGRVLASMTDVGARNIEFARNWLRTEGLSVAGEDVGDTHPRRVLYFPATGRVLMFRLRNVDHGEVVSREKQYQTTLRQKPAGNDVELF